MDIVCELDWRTAAQRNIKKQEGRILHGVMNMSQSSLSSAESALDDREGTWESGHKSKREAAFAAVEDPQTLKDAVRRIVPGMKYSQSEQPGESSKAAAQKAPAQDNFEKDGPVQNGNLPTQRDSGVIA